MLVCVGVAQLSLSVARACMRYSRKSGELESEALTGEESTTRSKLNDWLYSSDVYDTWHCSSIRANCACVEECVLNLQITETWYSIIRYSLVPRPLQRAKNRASNQTLALPL